MRKALKDRPGSLNTMPICLCNPNAQKFESKGFNTKILIPKPKFKHA